MPLLQQAVPVQHGETVTVTKYHRSEWLYLDVETEDNVDITFVQLTADQAADLVTALLEGLRALAAEPVIEEEQK